MSQFPCGISILLLFIYINIWSINVQCIVRFNLKFFCKVPCKIHNILKFSFHIFPPLEFHLIFNKLFAFLPSLNPMKICPVQHVYRIARTSVHMHRMHVIVFVVDSHFPIYLSFMKIVYTSIVALLIYYYYSLFVSILFWAIVYIVANNNRWCLWWYFVYSVY